MAQHPSDGADHRNVATPEPPPRRGPGLDVIAAWAVIVVGLGLILLAVAAPRSSAPAGGDATANAAAYASLGGPFIATDQEGRRVDQGVLKGKWSALFFGYVTCPDVCPITLQALAQTQARLGGDAGRFQVVFASVDPQRDSPDLVKAYLAQEGYPPHAVGLTGTVAQMERLEKAYRVYAALIPRSARDGGGYDVSHSGAIYLIDPRGVTTGVLSEGSGPAAMAAQVKTAMATGA